MAERNVYVGSVGPFLYDDADLIGDSDGDFSGKTYGPMVTDGVTVVGGTVIAVNGYLSFGSYGESFYGLRDNSGELEYKESGGIWKKIKEAWPIGSYYLNNGDDPATQLGYGTWVYVGRLAVI